jgi:hypothetical protein
MKIFSYYTIQNTNFSGNIPIKPNIFVPTVDKLELSAKSNLAELDLIPKKYINLFKERFFRNYTAEEISDMRNRYAEIIKISDTEEFLDKTCEELKKDYNIENLPIKLNTKFKSYNYADGITPRACCTPRYDKGYIEIGIDTKSQSKESLFRIMAHELRHVMQTVKCYQHSTNQEYANAMLENYKSKYQYSMLPDEDIMRLYITPFVNSMAEFFENLGIHKLERTENSYNFGRKILKSLKKPANTNAETYIDAYHERDAQETEKLMSNLVFYFNK